jgi:hypothetical protein
MKLVSSLLSLPTAIIALAQSPGTFTAIGNMTAPRYGHTTTLLANGKVLIFGGTVSDWDDSQASAELYDPATRTFTATGMMGGTLLPDGRLLSITGPHSAETYDPLTGPWR